MNTFSINCFIAVALLFTVFLRIVTKRSMNVDQRSLASTKEAKIMQALYCRATSCLTVNL